MTAQEIATLIKAAEEIHNASWQVMYAAGGMGWTKEWNQCLREVGMPNDWIELIEPYIRAAEENPTP